MKTFLFDYTFFATTHIAIEGMLLRPNLQTIMAP
jgi:hypothetical protein